MSDVLERCGINEFTTMYSSFEEDVRTYAGMGFGGIGVCLQKLEGRPVRSFWFPEAPIDPTVLDHAAQAVREAGLRTTHVLCSGMYTEPGAEARRRRVEHTAFALDAAERFEAECLLVIPGRLFGQTTAQAMQLAADALSDVLAASEGNTIPLAIEPVTNVDFAHTLSEALDLVDLVDAPRLGVYLDTFHLWQNDGITEQIERAGARILGVHVADGAGVANSQERLVPGEGVIPIVGFLESVVRTGYRGSYDIELFGEEIWKNDALELLERCAASLEALIPAAESAADRAPRG